MLGTLIKPFRFSYLYGKCRALKAQTNDKDFFSQLLNSKNYGDIYASLQGKNYGRFIKEPTYESIQKGLNLYFGHLYKTITKSLSKKEKRLFTLFFFGKRELLDKKQDIDKNSDIQPYQELDLDFTESLKEALKELNKEDRKDLEKIFGSYFDNMNLYTIFRLKLLYNAPAEEILPFLFPFGLHFGLKDLNSLLSLNSLNEFNDTLEPVYKESFGDLAHFRQVLYRHHYAILNSAWRGIPFKISVIFSLLRMKEIEIGNIRTVLEGVKYAQTREDIKRMVLGVTL